MEATAQSVEDLLIDGLSFKLRSGASYITNRRSVSYYPQGGNSYSPNGVKVIRLQLTGDSWLDPSTLRVNFTLVNDGSSAAQKLYPVSGPWSFFRRLRVLAGGQLIEDIDYYNRVHEMFHSYQSANVRLNDAAEGFLSNPYDLNTVYTLANIGMAIPGAGGSFTVSFRPLSGLINQDKYLPIRYCPITLEFETCNNMSDCIIVPNTGASQTEFIDANTSKVWHIEQFQVKADVVSLDNALDNEYAAHLLSGKSLPINFSTYTTQLQAITPNSNVAINVQRAFTRLKSTFVSLVNSNVINNGVHKEFNFFYNPGYTDATKYDSTTDFQFQMQIGSKQFPEMPITSNQEAFYQLRKCLGVQATTFHSIDVKPFDYQSTKYVIGIDTEKCLGSGFTGLNTKAGDLMTLKFNKMRTDGYAADKMYVIMHADIIMNIRDSGVEVFE